jgi:ATP-dependent Clp protease protease subunit
MTVKNTDLEAQMMAGQLGMGLGEQIRRIIVAGPIRDETSAYFIDQITAMEYAEVGVPINVYINSPGGQVDSALAMLDAMTCCSCPVKTIGIGQVASAAVLLMAAGERGNRIISPNCRVMIHQVSTGMMGNTAELENEIQEVLRLQEIYNKILSKYCGKSVSKLKIDMVQNKYMSAHEAIDYGIADKIMPTRKMGNFNIPGPKAKTYRKNKKDG